MAARFLPYISQKNEELTESFLLTDSQQSLELIQPQKHFLTGEQVSARNASAIKYQKIILQNSEEKKEFLPVATPNKIMIINRTGDSETNKFDRLIIRTSVKNIRKMLRAGIFSHKADEIESPIAKLIACYGEYYKTIFLRTKENNSVDQTKLEIVELTQKMIENLESLYYCVNNYDKNISPVENLNKLISVLEETRIRLATIRETEVEDWDPIEPKERKIKELYERKIAEQEAIINNYLTKIRSLNDAEAIQNLFKTYADPFSNNIAHLLEDQIIAINAMAYEANNLCSWGGIAAGELLKCIVEAGKITTDIWENPDYHNPATKEFDFFFDENEEQIITIDTRRFGFMPKNNLQLAQIIAHVQSILGVKEPDCADTYIPDWQYVGYYMVAGLSRTFIGILDVTIFTLFDLFTEKNIYLSNYVEPYIETFNPARKFYQFGLSKKVLTDPPITYADEPSPVTQIAPFIRRQIRKLTFDPLKAIFYDIPRDMWKVGSAFYFDHSLGIKKVSHCEIEEVLDEHLSLDDETEKRNQVYLQEYSANFLEKNSEAKIKLGYQLSADKHQEKTDIELPEIKSKQDVALSEQKYSQSSGKLAKLPYHLHPDFPHDVLSGSTDGYKVLFELFLYEFYEKHPIPATGFNASGFLIGLPFILSAAQTSAMGAIATKFAVPVGRAIAETFVGTSSGFMAGLSSGLIFAKATWLTLNFFEEGPNSTFAEILKGIAKTPIVVAAAAVFTSAIGYLLAFGMSIPYLSEEIASGASGAFPYVELSFAGAKICALIAEGLIDLSRKPDTPIEQIAELTRKKIIKYLQEHPQSAGLSLEQIEQAAQFYSQWLIDNHNKKAVTEIIENFRKTLENEKPQQSLTDEQFITELREIQSTISSAVTNVNWQKQRIINKINYINPEILSEKERYTLFHYIQQNYQQSDPDLVNSIYDQLYYTKSISPFVNTLRIAFDWLLLIIRTFLNLLTGGSNQQSYYQLKRKFFGDIGLILKAVYKVLKYAIKMIHQVLEKTAMLFLLLPLPGKNWRVQFLSWSRRRANDKLFLKLKRTAEWFIGGFRSVDKSKNLHLLMDNEQIKFDKIAEASTGQSLATRALASVRSEQKEVKMNSSSSLGIERKTTLETKDIQPKVSTDAKISSINQPTSDLKIVNQIYDIFKQNFTYAQDTHFIHHTKINFSFFSAKLQKSKKEINKNLLLNLESLLGRSSPKSNQFAILKNMFQLIANAITSIHKARLQNQVHKLGDSEWQMRAALGQIYDIVDSFADINLAEKNWIKDQLFGLIHLSQFDPFVEIKAINDKLRSLLAKQDWQRYITFANGLFTPLIQAQQSLAEEAKATTNPTLPNLINQFIQTNLFASELLSKIQNAKTTYKSAQATSIFRRNSDPIPELLATALEICTFAKQQEVHLHRQFATHIPNISFDRATLVDKAVAV